MSFDYLIRNRCNSDSHWLWSQVSVIRTWQSFMFLIQDCTLKEHVRHCHRYLGTVNFFHGKIGVGKNCPSPPTRLGLSKFSYCCVCFRFICWKVTSVKWLIDNAATRWHHSMFWRTSRFHFLSSNYNRNVQELIVLLRLQIIQSTYKIIASELQWDKNIQKLY